MENDTTQLIIGYLQKSLTPEETSRFYDWVNRSAANKELFFEIKAMYDAGASLGKPLDINGSWQRLLGKKKNTRFRTPRLWYRISSYAAVAVLAVAVSSLFFLYLYPSGSGSASRYIGGDGLEADVVVLPDGTQVSLGSNTTFHYDKDYGRKKRIVYLEGEAYFDVAKQKHKPFIVQTNEQAVEALGTKFNVTAYPADSLVTTTLLEGSVRLTTTNLTGQTVLAPGQQLVYNRRSHKIRLRQVDASQFISWTAGYYYFHEQSLEAILHRLSHVYGAQFTVHSETLGNRTFTGTFYRGQSIEDILEIIDLSIPLGYKIDDRKVTIFDK